jgi:hypothetical protein
VTSSPTNTASAEVEPRERTSLVDVDHRQLDDLLALGHVHPGPPSRTRADLVEDADGVVPRRSTDMDGGAGGLALEQDARRGGGRPRELEDQLRAEPLLVLGQHVVAVLVHSARGCP